MKKKLILVLGNLLHSYDWLLPHYCRCTTVTHWTVIRAGSAIGQTGEKIPTTTENRTQVFQHFTPVAIPGHNY